MTFDFAHAVVSGVLIFLTIFAMHKMGLYKRRDEGGPVWSWPLFFAIIVVMTVLNLIWP